MAEIGTIGPYLPEAPVRLTGNGQHLYAIGQIKPVNDNTAKDKKGKSPRQSENADEKQGMDVEAKEDKMEEDDGEEEEEDESTWVNMVVDVYELKDGMKFIRRVVIDKYQQHSSPGPVNSCMLKFYLLTVPY